MCSLYTFAQAPSTQFSAKEVHISRLLASKELRESSLVPLVAGFLFPKKSLECVCSLTEALSFCFYGAPLNSHSSTRTMEEAFSYVLTLLDTHMHFPPYFSMEACVYD